jgi:SAM-dependent methyltransferase
LQRVDFDAIYQSKRTEGRYGWHDLPLYAERVAVAEAFLARNQAKAGDRVLFLGCGAGHTLLAMARNGFEVAGIDISAVAIAWAREQAAEAGLRADLRVGDVVTLASYPDATFPFVVDDYCLQCAIGADRATAFSNIFRIVEPGGAFLAGTDCTSDLHIASSEDPVFDGQSRCLTRDGIPYSYLTLDGELEAEIARAGFLVRCRGERRRKQGAPNYHAGRQWIDAVKPR